MTCIAGLVHDGKVYIGGDSAGANSSWDLTIRADPKVFAIDEWIFGFTTSFRMGQLIRYAFRPPPMASRHDDDLHRYMCVDFVNGLRQCLKDGGYARKDNEVESGGSLLVGAHGHLYSIQDDYQVSEAADGYAAVGCGASVAAGSLYSTPERRPRDRVRMALMAAERHSAGVRGPFAIVETPDRPLHFERNGAGHANGLVTSPGG